MFIGAGTLVNAGAVVLGSGLGMLLGHRLPQRTRTVVTDALGLVTLLLAALSAMSVRDADLVRAVGSNAPVLIVLGSVLIGGIVGSLLRIEDRLENLGGWMQGRLERGYGDDRTRFIEGYVTASLIFCVGPLTVLGSINEGLGNGAQELVLKSVLDGFASIAFAASFGVGVMAAAFSVVIVQGTLTVLGVLLGSFIPEPQVVALTATGGLLLAGVGIRLLHIKQVAVGDLLPALIVAPLLTQLVVSLS